MNLLTCRSLRVLLLLKRKLKRCSRDGSGSRCCIFTFPLFAVIRHSHTVRHGTCPHKPLFLSATVARSSADRCKRRSSLSSAAWPTSVMPFIGCHLASCGRDDSPAGLWDWWALSHLWLVWSRWMQATVTRQIVHSLLWCFGDWQMLIICGKCWVKRLCGRSLMWSDFNQTVDTVEINISC